VGPFGFVQLQSVRDRVQHGLRGATEIAAFEPYVVLDAHAREQRDLFSAQALHPAVPSPRRQPCILRRETGAS
jgi:hypothetical protein